MQLNPYGHDVVVFAAELANDPPTSSDDLTRRCRAAGVAVDAPADEADLALVHAVLGRWLGVVDAVEAQERVTRTNELLTEFCSHPRLTDHDADGWHLHYRDDDLALGRAVGSLISMGTALHLTGRGTHRLGRCAARTCHRVFADVSRTGRRRYCTTTCANRDAVRRHRASRH